jgi:curved DNA-binding protein CbpA
MLENDYQLTELRHAYQVLGVPTDTAAPSIKYAYRRLVKRWHPDLYANGTPAHVEATQMTRLINEAYSAIAHAPLRYHVETYPNPTKGNKSQPPSPSPSERTGVTTEEIPKTDGLEFWVRFVCGAFFGVFVIFDMFFLVMPDFLRLSGVPALGALGLILGCGLAAARYGDKFWYSIFRRWWLWS